MPSTRALLTTVGGLDQPSGEQRIITGNDAKHLAHLTRIHADMVLTVYRCARYIEVEATAGDDKADELLMYAESAFIAYGRCKDGAEGAVPAPLMNGLSSEEEELHNWAFAIRNKFVGHSTNAMNRSVAMASIIVVEGVPQIEQVWGTNIRVVPTVDDIRDLERLAQRMIALIDALIASVAATVSATPELAAKSLRNPQLQLDVVSRDGFDYLARRGPLQGKMGLPARLNSDPDDDANTGETAGS